MCSTDVSSSLLCSPGGTCGLIAVVSRFCYSLQLEEGSQKKKSMSHVLINFSAHFDANCNISPVHDIKAVVNGIL